MTTTKGAAGTAASSTNGTFASKNSKGGSNSGSGTAAATTSSVLPNNTSNATTTTTQWYYQVIWSTILLYMTYVAVRQAYTIRLRAIIDYGPVIHEFDPYFNYRATEVRFISIYSEYDVLWWWLLL